MKNTKIILRSLLNSVGVYVYILLISLFFQNAEKLVGKVDHTILAPVVMLSLFVFSASITGLLVLGYPIWLYLENKKKEGIKALFFTLGSLLTILALIILILFLFM